MELSAYPREEFKPLTGIRVLDFSHVIAGPFATFLLAQLGATVIKVESVEGDVMRTSDRGAHSFVSLNADKDCIRLDLQTEAGLSTAHEMAASCHVLVDNLRPGVLQRFGLDFHSVKKMQPRLVYCTISGFGRGAEEWSQRPAYDHVIQAMTGMAWMSGEEGGPPVKTGFPVIDSATGILAAMAILAALRQSERTGEAMLLDVSMAGAALQLMYPMACDAMNRGVSPERVGNSGFSGSPAASYFETADGWLAVGANTPRQLLSLLEVMNLADLASDVRYFDPPLAAGAESAFARSKDPAALRCALQEGFRARTALCWELALNGARVPAARVLRIAEYVAQAEQNGCIQPLNLSMDGATARSPGTGFQVYR